jgi:hypothetical protein
MAGTFLNPTNLATLVETTFPGTSPTVTEGGAVVRVEFNIWYFEGAFSLTSFRISHKDKDRVGHADFTFRFCWPRQRPVPIEKRQVKSLEEAITVLNGAKRYLNGIIAAMTIPMEPPGDYTPAADIFGGLAPK